MKIFAIFIILLSFAAAAAVVVQGTNNDNKTDNALANNALNTDIQSSDISIEPGISTSWDDVQNIQDKAQNTVPSQLQRKEIPIGYEISKNKLEQIKNKPFTPSGNVFPTNERDTNVPTDSTDTTISISTTPKLLSGFEGLSNIDQTSGSIFIPPDPDIAVGPNHVGTTVNLEFAFYTKSGILVKKTNFPLWFRNIFTPCQTCFITDPKIVFTPEGRWIMLVLAGDSAKKQSWYLVSVSKTSDPTGGWFNYKINGALIFNGLQTWADYPDVGFDRIPSSNGAIYFTSNQFDWTNFNFQTSLISIIPKSILYSGGTPNSTNVKRFFGIKNFDGSPAFTLRAAKTFSNYNGEFLINDVSYGGNFVTLWKATPKPATLTKVKTISIGSYSPPPSATQKGCSGVLDTIDSRIYTAEFRNNNLYAAFTEAFNWGNGTVATIRYLKINTTSNGVVLNSRYGADKIHFWFPSIIPDSKNNILFTFARSSPSQFAGLYYSGRKTTDTKAAPSSLLKAGQECIVEAFPPAPERWGDYFGIRTDPANESRVWIYGEYAKSIGKPPGWDWGTRVGQISYS